MLKKQLIIPALLALTACAPPPEIPHQAIHSPPPQPTTSVKKATPNPTFLAEHHAKQTELRLSQIPYDPEFNGFQDLKGLSNGKGGLLSLSINGDQKELTSAISDKNSLLRDDIAILKRILTKPRVTAPLELADESDFLETLDSLSFLPAVYAQLASTEDQIDGHLFALKLGRQLSVNSSRAAHYDGALTIQVTALEKLNKLLAETPLPGERYRTLVTRLQMEVSSPAELLEVFDNEYLLASKQLKSLNFTPEQLAMEQRGLAARYLKLRPFFAASEIPPKNFKLATPIPDLENATWTKKQDDFLSLLKRSRTASTELSALELRAALEAFKSEKLNHPETLEELIPAYLTRIPENHLSPDGEFQYQPENGRIILPIEL